MFCLGECRGAFVSLVRWQCELFPIVDFGAQPYVTTDFVTVDAMFVRGAPRIGMR